MAGARVAASNAIDTRGEAIVVALRKGGYAVATTLEPRLSPLGSISSRHYGAPTLFMRLLERSALFFFLCASILTCDIEPVVAPLVKLARESRALSGRKRAFAANRRSRAARGARSDASAQQNADRIEAMIEARSHALAAISHDLRTIITRVRLSPNSSRTSI